MTDLYDTIEAIHLMEQSANILPHTTLEEFTAKCTEAALMQRAVPWWIGDLALAVERQHPRTHHQAWPEWMSPDLIARCKAVSEAYPPEDRNLQATWTVHMRLAGRGDRVAAVQETVEAGQTSDEVRRDPPPVSENEPLKDETATGTMVVHPKPEVVTAPQLSTNWLLAVDVNYFVVRFYASGSGVEAAQTVVHWLARLIERLQVKGLTDAVCCMDSVTNHRKALTQGWEHGYKDRTEKPTDLIEQLKLAPKLLEQINLPVVSIMDMEADDVMASYARRFDGKVTLLTADKDMRQCLSANVNILENVQWEDHPETGKQVPVYKWVSAKSHIEDGMSYSSTKVSGITPEQWPHFQAIAGDSVDGIKGCVGIGAKGAADLIKAHGTVQAVIDACRDGVADLSKIKRMAVLDFEPFAETMLKLTTLRTNLDVPMTTKLCMKETT